MSNTTKGATPNPMGTEPTGKLLLQYSIPGIIAMLVGSIYNIVDQFFIGRYVGELGNAATNIAFPLSISCIALALLFGMGGAMSSNLALGRGEQEKAATTMGNALTLILISGVTLSAITLLFLEPLLKFFGSPAEVLNYAKTYTGITAFGFPFLILTSGGGHLIRGDGRATASMLCNLSGAILNVFLDALFIPYLGWGMAGAAWATVIGQVGSGLLTIWYLTRCRNVTLRLKHLKLKADRVKQITSLGTAAFLNQLAMMVVQIAMNNTLKHYGALSVYGESIPIAVVGIITKVNQAYMSFIIGISHAMQPLTSFNYGAKQYDRTKRVFLQAMGASAVISVITFLLFQLFPRQIIGFFGEGSPEYYQFAVQYFRIFLFFTFLNFVAVMSSNYFTSIGKPKQGTFVSLSRQVIFFLPLLVVLPLFMGIDGVLYVGPISDFLAFVATEVLLIRELRQPHYKRSGPQN